MRKISCTLFAASPGSGKTLVRLITVVISTGFFFAYSRFLFQILHISALLSPLCAFHAVVPKPSSLKELLSDKAMVPDSTGLRSFNPGLDCHNTFTLSLSPYTPAISSLHDIHVSVLPVDDGRASSITSCPCSIRLPSPSLLTVSYTVTSDVRAVFIRVCVRGALALEATVRTDEDATLSEFQEALKDISELSESLQSRLEAKVRLGSIDVPPLRSQSDDSGARRPSFASTVTDVAVLFPPPPALRQQQSAGASTIRESGELVKYLTALPELVSRAAAHKHCAVVQVHALRLFESLVACEPAGAFLELECAVLFLLKSSLCGHRCSGILVSVYTMPIGPANVTHGL